MSEANSDYYSVLGVPRDADEKTIKGAYRRIAFEHHPDRNPGNKDAEEKFKCASEAYEVLSDPQKRAVYDRFGRDGLRGTGFRPFTDVEDIFSSFGDIFEQFFGFGRTGRHGGRRGTDIKTEVQISLREAAFGTEREIEVQNLVMCRDCEGTGAKRGTKPSRCDTCGGHGEVGINHGFITISKTCPKCYGSGFVIREKCESCLGAGKISAARRLNIKIPAGVDDGMQLRLAGEGEGGDHGGPTGDLYVLVRVKSAEGLQRDGEDLHCCAKISFVMAALGGKVKIPTIEGETEIDVPRGTQPSDIIKLAGLGIPRLNGYGRGDQRVHFQVEIPKKISTEQEEILKSFAHTMGDSEKLKGKKSLFGRNK